MIDRVKGFGKVEVQFYVGSGKCPPGGGDSNVTIKNWKLLRKKARSAPDIVTMRVKHSVNTALDFLFIYLASPMITQQTIHIYI